jgi:hypothetical protein
LVFVFTADAQALKTLPQGLRAGASVASLIVFLAWAVPAVAAITNEAASAAAVSLRNI